MSGANAVISHLIRRCSAPPRACRRHPWNKHRDRWVSKALDAFVSGLDVEATGVAEAVFGFCLDSIAEKRVPNSVKATLFDKVQYHLIPFFVLFCLGEGRHVPVVHMWAPHVAWRDAG